VTAAFYRDQQRLNPRRPQRSVKLHRLIVGHQRILRAMQDQKGGIIGGDVRLRRGLAGAVFVFLHRPAEHSRLG